MGNIFLKSYTKIKVQYKRNGDRYYKEKRYNQALSWYESGLRVNPNNINLLVSAGNALFKLFNIERSIPIFYKAIKLAHKKKVFQIIVNKYYQRKVIDYKSFIKRLHNIHNLKIESKAIPYIISYIHDIQIHKYSEDQYQIFKKNFEKNTIKTFENLLDEYIINYFVFKSNQYLFWFHRLCSEKGYHLDINQLNQHVLDRVDYWNNFYRNNPDVMPLLTKIDRMDGLEFEKFIKNLFQKKGYKTRLTKKSKDEGGDIIVYNGYDSIAIQSKRWNKTVRVNAIQEAHTAKDIYDTERAMVITNSSFSDDAIKMADKLNIELWDRNRLIQEIMKNL